MAPAPAPGTAAPAARNFAQAKAAPRASLAGIACCGDLPEREGLGPPLEEELPAGHVLDDRFVIQEAIGRLIQGRTTFAIAHRLSTLRNASRLVVLEKGEIAEIGTHEELMEKQGVFYNLVQTQTAINEIIGLGAGA